MTQRPNWKLNQPWWEQITAATFRFNITHACQAMDNPQNLERSPNVVEYLLCSLRTGEAAFRQCVDAMGCPAAVQASAKGMFPETHPQYLGVYWGVVSSQHVAARMKQADALLVVGGCKFTFNATYLPAQQSAGM